MAKLDWQYELRQLREDNRSGAQEIATRALHLLLDRVGDSQPRGVQTYRRWLLRSGRELIAVQPAMGVLFRMVNDMLWASDRGMNAETIRQDAMAFLQDYQMRFGARIDTLNHQASAYLARYERIATYSRSSTLVGALNLMRRKRLQVFCGEGRPMYEGQTLANELAWAGHSVVLGVDMALFGWLSQVEALVVGADGLSRDGLVNKLGTAALMRAAADIELPRIVICTADKLLPTNCLPKAGLGGGDPQEIMPASEEAIEIRNDYFDVTPLEDISLVLTDEGILQGETLYQTLDGLEVYPGLRST